jgi:hypothetical protein
MDKGSHLPPGEPCGQEGPARDQESGLEHDEDADDYTYEGLAVLENLLRQGDFSRLGERMELNIAKAAKVVRAVQSERRNTLRRLRAKERRIAGLEDKLELHPRNRSEDLSKIETLWQSNFLQKSVIADKDAEIDYITQTLARTYANEARRGTFGAQRLLRLDTTNREMQEELVFYRRLHANSDAPPCGERLARHAAASTELRAHLVCMHGLYGERAYRDERRDFTGGTLDSAHEAATAESE